MSDKEIEELARELWAIAQVKTNAGVKEEIKSIERITNLLKKVPELKDENDM